jgi:NADPH2:quinone reductase
MRGFAIRNFGETPAIHNLPIPAADGAFLIRVKYAGVNPIDCRLLEKLTATSTYPFVMGIDFAGVVECGPVGERDFHTGDRIFGMARSVASAASAQVEAFAIPAGHGVERLAMGPKE